MNAKLRMIQSGAWLFATLSSPQIVLRLARRTQIIGEDGFGLMKIAFSWQKLALGLSAVAICALGVFSQPAGLVARTSSARSLAAQPAARPAPDRQQTEKKVVTANDAYMNVQVLKDIPSDQLLPAMRYITSALGVECNFCHDTKDFSSDDKPEKTTARNMMKMMFAINKDNFNGRREVTCYTCHHGISHAANIPVSIAVATPNEPGGAMPPANRGPENAPPAGAAAAGAPATPMPTVDAILAKYTAALGGDAAIAKITTLSEKGTVEMPTRGMHASVEALRKAPDEALTIVHLPMGEFAQGYDGAVAWQQRPGRPVDTSEGDELVRTKFWAVFIPGLDIKKDFSRAQVLGVEKIGDHDAYRVIAFRAGSGSVRFYFDQQSGLLLRVSERIESPLGALPQDTDYSDYRDVNGVKIPFSITVAHAEGPTIYKWEQIDANAALDDSRFARPAEKPKQ